MSKPRPFVTQFRGMRQDDPRELMPRDAAWNSVDWIPNLGGPARKRGGWAYASPDISGVKATASYIQAVAYAPFAAGAKLVAIDEDGELYTVASASSATDVGAALAPLQSPVFHRNLLIIPASDGTTAPKKYSGSAIGNLGGSPPAMKRAAVYKDRTLLSNSSAQPQRINFSNAGDPETWQASGYIDASGAVDAIGVLRNAVLVWSPGRTERLRGTTPPPNTDMVLEPIFDQGCLDQRSVVPYSDYLVFANGTGVYLTDGAVIVDLTKAGGISRYWRSALSAWTTSWTIAAGLHRNMYVVSLMNGSTFVDCLACDLDSRTWIRFSNVKATCFSRVVGAAPELYWGSRAAPRVNSLSSFFAPSSTYKNDGDGTAVTPVYESPMTPAMGKLRMRGVFTAYDLRDAASDNPYLTLSYLTTPESTSYTAMTPTLTETTSFKRMRTPLGGHADAYAFKVAQTNASSDTYLYSIELDGYAEESGRVG